MAKLISKSKRHSVWEKTDGECWYCGSEINPFTFHIDHVVPVAKGGTHHLDNLVPACRPCNMTKGSRDLDYLRHKLHWKAEGVTPFTDDQIEYLAEMFGIVLDSSGYQFWFEMMGQWEQEEDEFAAHVDEEMARMWEEAHA